MSKEDGSFNGMQNPKAKISFSPEDFSIFFQE